jgi:uncharacterized protein
MQEISIRVKKLRSIWQTTRGLIGYATPESIFFKTRFGIHTFGLSFPIDVLILDEKDNVVVLKESLPPNKLFFWNPRYSTVIELPQNTIMKKKIKKGMRIKIAT